MDYLFPLHKARHQLSELSERAHVTAEKVLLLVLLAGALCVHTLFLLQPVFQDELLPVKNALTFLSEKTVVPYRANYPTLYSLLVTPLTALPIVAAKLLGGATSLKDAAAYLYVLHMDYLVLPGRIVSSLLLLGAATAVVIFGRRTGATLRLRLWTALTVLTSQGLFEYSGYNLPDVLVFHLGVISLLIVLPDESGHLPGRRLLLGALLAGLATSAKYNAASSVLAVALAALSHCRAGIRVRAHRLIAVGVASLAGFLAGSPGWLVAPDKFLEGLSSEAKHAAYGHLGLTGVPLLGQLELLIRHFPIIFILGAIGGFLGRRTRTAGPSLVAAFGGLVVCSLSSKQSFHYLLPTVAGFIGLALHCGRGDLGKLTREAVATKSMLVVGIICAIASGLQSSAHFLKPNTTELTRSWLYEHVPKGEAVSTDIYTPELYSEESIQAAKSGPIWPYSSRIESSVRSTHRLYKLVDTEYDARWVDSTEANFFVTSEGAYRRLYHHGIFTALPPDANTPLASDFKQRREFYDTLFSSPEWTLVFQADTGNGPATFVYQRNRLIGARSKS